MARIATTLLEKPMADVLIRHILNLAGGEPLTMADIRILLPNRRSCIAFKKRFAELAGGKAQLMPQIYPIGEVDEDALAVAGLFADGLLAQRLEQVRPAVGATQRLLAVAQEVFARRESYGLLIDDVEQAARLAGDICRFLDEMERDGVAADALQSIWPERFADHWQRSLGLLRHIAAWWPRQLDKLGMQSVIGRRNELLGLLTDHWAAHPPVSPVIAAGSTGTQPATAALLRVVAGLPEGMVVVPGLDIQADAAVWEAMEPSHPQYGLLRLLAALGVTPAQVELLDDEAVQGGSHDRARLLLESCRPAALTAGWKAPAGTELALSGFERIDCEHEWEEAQVVCLLLREVLEVPHKQAALVTHDAALVRRVCALMRRYGIELDSASGQALLRHPVWQVFDALSAAASQPFAPMPLLALLKHPLCAVTEATLNALERDVCRGQRRNRDMLAQLLWYVRSERCNADIADEIMRLCEWLGPLYQRFASPRTDAVMLLAVQRRCLEAMSVPVDAAMDALFAELEQALEPCGAVTPATYHQLLRQCLALHKWFPQGGGHARLHVYSPMEARMQPMDRVILGGLNEGVWPHAPAQDAWMNEAMRQSIGLPPCSARQGQEAHDWLMFASYPEVFVTRSLRSGGADTLPSRWLERIDTYMGYDKKKRESYQRSPYIDWARMRMQADEVVPLLPPAPVPPVEALPASVSVTQMETWLRNPYAAYARHILRLKPLRELDEDLSAADMGDVLHRILERFVEAVNADAAQLDEAVIVRIADEVLALYADQPQVMLFWRPRVIQLLPWLVQQERERRAVSRKVLAEQRREAVFSHLGLFARMDRMEAVDAGAWRLIDYKTRNVPKDKDVQLGYACQLPLSALILMQAEGAMIEALEYWSLGGGYGDASVHGLGGKQVEIAELIDFYREGLLSTLAHYYEGGRPFYAIPVPRMRAHFDDYEHLARIEEWLNS